MADTPYLFITAVVVPVSAILGGLLKGLWDYAKNRGQNAIRAREVELNDGDQLRKDLLAERKVLLEQVLSERRFYSAKVEALEKRVDSLEQEGRDKDQKILELERSNNALRIELDQLKAHDDKIQHPHSG